jgi:hypothetical protein
MRATRVPAGKPEVVTVIKDTLGNVIFTGTVDQWRAWVKERRKNGELYTPPKRSLTARRKSTVPKQAKRIVPKYQMSQR